MNLAHHYQTLGLRRGASLRDVKTAYRGLARRYHPDTNPGEQAIEHFIQINDAYTAIVETLRSAGGGYKAQDHSQAQTEAFDLDGLRLTLEQLGIGNFDEEPSTAYAAAPYDQTEWANGSQSASSARPAGDQLSDREESLKQEAYSQLKELLRQQKFPRAVALVEGLAQRMPADSEISQWQAIVYQRWGRQLIGQGQLQKARIYLKKALRTDPNNQSLWREVNHDFWQLANLTGQSSSAT
ncbi:J domain-containing protein [Leptolyngbya sp. BC1307]|uniref:J domain-containing protein n=1 Tax=Leptolyngbya sp. BC1307 TaxID=2029589 RepID=UPI000EFD9D77|nr:J domain-containing protein [Leptolyngbya sp. BC1307]